MELSHIKKLLREQTEREALDEAAFGQAYSAARKAGQPTFTFNGKSYSSELDKKSTASNVPLPKARPSDLGTTPNDQVARRFPSDDAFKSTEKPAAAASSKPEAPKTDSDTFRPKITAYSPQTKGSKMEGGLASSRPGPDGKALVRTFDDYASGKSQHVTFAGHPSQYGKEYTIPSIKYRNSAGEEKELTNVRGVVHDTGDAFRGKGKYAHDLEAAKAGRRLDVAVGTDYKDKDMNAQSWSMKSDVDFKSGWKPAETKTTETPEEDKPKKVSSVTDSVNEEDMYQTGVNRLRDAFAKKQQEVQKRMDSTVDRMKLQDKIQNVVPEPADSTTNKYSNGDQKV